ncbi:unnamed protein product [Amoebophrya sp. A25]|nr:unnamed protein product [Amoebophrya sp. A25]|eukprot:GSA25T00023776001.1
MNFSNVSRQKMKAQRNRRQSKIVDSVNPILSAKRDDVGTLEMIRNIVFFSSKGSTS